MALEAGNLKGGDRRGLQAAVIKVVPTPGEPGLLVDLRVDDNIDPMGQLARYVALHELYFGASQHEDKLALDGHVLEELQVIMRRTGFYDGVKDGCWSESTARALYMLTAWENLEERIDLEYYTIDRPALEHLRTLVYTSTHDSTPRPDRR